MRWHLTDCTKPWSVDVLFTTNKGKSTSNFVKSAHFFFLLYSRSVFLSFFNTPSHDIEVEASSAESLDDVTADEKCWKVFFTLNQILQCTMLIDKWLKVTVSPSLSYLIDWCYVSNLNYEWWVWKSWKYQLTQMLKWFMVLAEQYD